MRKTGCMIMVLVLFFFGTGLFETAGGGEPAPCDYKQLGLDASKFYLYLTKDTPYAKWPVWPGKDRLSPGKKPHGAFVKTYLNPAAHEAVEKGGALPYGSILVSENYDADKNRAGLMVMLKVKGYNPPAGDWYWFHFDAQGTGVASGRAADCIACHQDHKDNDFIMTGLLGK